MCAFRVCHVLSYLSRLINAFVFSVRNCYFLNAFRSVFCLQIVCYNDVTIMPLKLIFSRPLLIRFWCVLRCSFHFHKKYIRYLPRDCLYSEKFNRKSDKVRIDNCAFTTFRRFGQWRNPRAHDIASISCTFVIILFASSIRRQSGSAKGRVTAPRVSLARVIYRRIILSVGKISNSDF